MSKVIGRIEDSVVSALNINKPSDSNIYIGESNIAHMQKSHPKDYAKYGVYIGLILSNPDYVGINPTDGSIEYVKEFLVEKDFVKVAVRVSASNRYYARSLYVLNPNRVKNYIAKGTLKKT